MIRDMKFERRRGIVWVCDVAGSSKALNDPALAGSAETFLQRLHWIAVGAVESSGGTFIKWTGDGFLAWYEVDLHRTLPTYVETIMEAITWLSMLNNLSQFDVRPPPRLGLRHALTFEHDAVLI